MANIHYRSCQAAIGHQLPLAVTFGFVTLSGSKRQLYGDEVGTRFGSTRPEAAIGLLGTYCGNELVAATEGASFIMIPTQ